MFYIGFVKLVRMDKKIMTAQQSSCVNIEVLMISLFKLHIYIYIYIYTWIESCIIWETYLNDSVIV
jgi:hypothetical protein